MATNTGELRESLIDCIERVKNGTMSASNAKAVAMLAAQVSLSLQVEINVQRVSKDVPAPGQLALGEGLPKAREESVEDVTPRIPSSVWPGTVTTHRISDD